MTHNVLKTSRLQQDEKFVPSSTIASVHNVFLVCPYLPSPSLQFGQEQATRRSLLLGGPSWSEELWTEPSWSGLIDEPDATLPTATVKGDD